MTTKHFFTKENWGINSANKTEINSPKGIAIAECHRSKMISQLEKEANAQLIADAGTTANKCGLLPSELLEQRNELLETLQGTMKALKRMIDKYNPDTIEAEWVGNANESLLKATI